MFAGAPVRAVACAEESPVEQFWAIVVAIVPSIGVGFLFYKVIKAILEGDRNERLAHSRWEAERERSRESHALHAGDETSAGSARE